MLYYDDRDYFYNSENIDELYDTDDYGSEEVAEDPTFVTSWEYDYHNIANELEDD